MANQRVVCGSLDSALVSASSPYSFGSSSMVSFGNVSGGKRSMVSFEDVNTGKRSDGSSFHLFGQEVNIDEVLDEYYHQPEKKRRLTPGQIQFLERNFEVDNKLEPERKIQLAKDIGLQPRQVAIWFQNRRARLKTNDLEKDYKALQTSYNSLKADYNSILKEKEKLEAEVLHITENLLFTQKGKGSLELSDTKEQPQLPPEKPIAGSVCDEEVSKVSIVACSDVVDSVSLPSYINGFHSSHLEPGGGSFFSEPDQSDLSQDEADNFSWSLESPAAYLFPNIGDADIPELPANSCYFGFQIEDHNFGFRSD